MVSEETSSGDTGPLYPPEAEAEDEVQGKYPVIEYTLDEIEAALEEQGTLPDNWEQIRRDLLTSAHPMEELHQLRYLVNALESWQSQPELTPLTLANVIQEIRNEIGQLEEALGLTETPIVPETVFEEQAVPVVPTQVPGAETLVVEPQVTVPLKGMGPVKPPREPFSWAKVGDALLSRRALQTFLYIGATLLVLSAIILVVRLWTDIHWVPRQAILLIGMAALLWSGFYVRHTMGLRLSGGALMDIGALWVPLNVGAFLFEFMEFTDEATIPGVGVPLGLPMLGWMTIAAISTPVYAFLAYRYRLILIAIGAAIGLSATLLTGLAALDVTLEWQLTSIVVIGPAFLWIAGWLRNRGRPELEQSLFWLVQAAVPALLVTIVALVATEDGSQSAVTVSVWLTGLFYLVSFRLYRHLVFEALGALSLPTAFLLTLSMHADAVPMAWYNMILVGTTIAYVCTARFIRNSPLWTRSNDTAMSVMGFRVDPLYLVALVMAVAATIWPVATVPSATASLYSVAVFLGVVAWLFQQRSAAYLAAFLLFAPFTWTILWADVGDHWRAMLFAPLAMAYLALAEIDTARAGETRLPLRKLLSPVEPVRGLFARPLFLAGYASTFVAMIFGAVELFRYSDATQSPQFIGAGPAPWTYLWVAGVYVASAYLRRSSAFVHLAALVFLPFALLLAERGFYLGSSFEDADYYLLLGGLSLGYLGAGMALDRLPAHYSKVVYLVGYTLMAVGMVGTSGHKVFNLSLVSMSVAIYAGSAYLVHIGRHPSFRWLIDQVFPFSHREELARRIARGSFLYLAAGLFPVAVLLAVSFADPSAAWYGLALTLIGLSYLGIAEIFTYRDVVYRYHWHVIGVGLSIIGPVVTLDDPTLRLAALGAATLGYCAMAFFTRRPLWIYPVAILLPALMTLGMVRAGAPEQYFGVALVGLTAVYGALGLVWRPDNLSKLLRPEVGRAGSFVLPFFILAFVLSPVGIGLSALESSGIIVATLGVGSLYYLMASIALRQTVLLYPFAALLASAYSMGLTITGIGSEYYGLLLLPGVVVSLSAALILHGYPDRYRFRSWFIPSNGDKPWLANPGPNLLLPMFPFALAAYAGSVAVPILSANYGWQLFAGLVSITAIYGYSAWRFRAPLWCYVALPVAHIALVKLLFLLSPTMSVDLVGAYMVPAVYLVVMLGALMLRLQGRDPEALPITLSIDSLAALSRRWALPFFIVAALGAVSSSILASFQDDTGLAAALAYSVPLAIAASLARLRIVAWAALSFLALAFAHGMRWGDVPLLEAPIYVAISAAVLVVVSYFIYRSQGKARETTQKGLSLWDVWDIPIKALSFIAIGLAPILGLSFWLAEGADPDELQPLVLTLAITGLALVGVAYLQRRVWLSYLAVALLEASYMTQLALFNTGQAQFFVFPAALFLVAVAYLERAHSDRFLVVVLESVGLSLLLGVTLLQSLGLFTDDVNHQFYSLFLFFESLLVVIWGLSIRWKRPFFGGIAAFIANLAVLLFDPLGEGPVSATILWSVFGAVGISLVAGAVYLERNRERSSAAFRRLVDQLSRWS